MLKRSCRRFRACFSLGAAGSPGAAHRRRCPECAALAEHIERAAEIRLPLPERLRSELRAIGGVRGTAVAPTNEPGPELPAFLPFVVPALALPDRLHRRLVDLGHAERKRGRLPVWLRSPRYAIAASYLLTILSAALFGNPVDLGRRASAAIARELHQALGRTTVESRPSPQRPLSLTRPLSRGPHEPSSPRRRVR
ncbi:MAG TPA: hypothetical protein VOA87_01590 [Thermoanaerobaculia bacterium]|nr:hypothetical protein [Thermoanaerobaculia bacterium]